MHCGRRPRTSGRGGCSKARSKGRLRPEGLGGLQNPAPRRPRDPRRWRSSQARTWKSCGRTQIEQQTPPHSHKGSVSVASLITFSGRLRVGPVPSMKWYGSPGKRLHKSVKQPLHGVIREAVGIREAVRNHLLPHQPPSELTDLTTNSNGGRCKRASRVRRKHRGRPLSKRPVLVVTTTRPTNAPQPHEEIVWL